jgi:uncharacterized protein
MLCGRDVRAGMPIRCDVMTTAKKKTAAKKKSSQPKTARAIALSVTAIVHELRAFYATHCPRMLDPEHRIKVATPDDLTALETTLGVALPADLRELLVSADFRVRFEGHFTSLDRAGIEGNWASMTRHLRKGTFAGWVEKRAIEDNNPGIREQKIQKCWWSEAWIPFAEDSCGNMKCVDVAPGPKGTTGQVLSMEVQDGIGPCFSGALSLREYLIEQLGFLRSRKYAVTDEGFLEIDRYL